MSAAALDAANPSLVPVSLSDVASSAGLPNGAFRGRITAVRAFSPHTKLAQLVIASLDASDPPQTRVEVELKGDWADKPSRRFLKGDILVLRTVNASSVERKGKEKAGEPAPLARIRYDAGLTGWLQRSGVDELLQYKGRTPDDVSGSATSSDVSRPPASAGPPSAQKVSAPGEGSRSVKRRRQEEKLGWEFKAADGTVYTPLEQLGGIVSRTSNTSLQSKKVSVAAVVFDPGEVCAPRFEGRDWYRSFTVADPTAPNKPVEVQWYAKAGTGVPAPEYGDVLVARNLVLKSTSSVSNPILLAKSFTVIAHALCRSPALLAKPPTQDPRPSARPPPNPPTTSADLWHLGLAADELAHAARVARWFRSAGKAMSSGAAVKPGLAGQGVSPSVPALRLAGEAQNRRASGGGARGRPTLRIEEIEENGFCDLVAMVTKLHSTYPLHSVPSNQSVSLYVTDYTPHAQLYAYGDPSPVGLPGKLVLQVSVFGYQATPLAALLDAHTGEAKRGTLVHLRNVRIKANGAEGLLEGTMVEERREERRHQRDVTVLDLRRAEHAAWGDRARAVQSRHRKYWGAKSLLGGNGGA
ncbi:hypothetical protein Rhopal_007271-T1 [Rhodotorula paludigena]|uniref:Protection of telomeres protein 1 ssDNA-binding domain-containing protein n=1 Tax=Rhodotorula paludigena TaxID=86838 RepID=A0AAV5GXY0_9BASI|nr:hypothetical protein Rhopal_007271-T1 [Rhodotorula paludigena]